MINPSAPRRWSTSSGPSPASRSATPLPLTRADGVDLLARAQLAGGAVLVRFDGGRVAGYEVIAMPSRYPRPFETRECACGATMIVRTAARTGNLFWGCTTFPRCRALIPIDVECTISYPKELPW